MPDFDGGGMEFDDGYEDVADYYDHAQDEDYHPMTHPPIGIDLGTTFSALAVINQAGAPVIVHNADGDNLTASAVYFEAGAMDQPVVGSHALGAAGGFPDRVVRDVKRHMGKPDWRKPIDGREYSAIDISSLILKKVIQDASVTLGPLEYAVITVPAYFQDPRRRATLQAAEKAGIKVLRLISEPTAAALAYVHAGQVQGKVLIYDFGGGTLDVTLAEIISKKELNVIGVDGRRLGGNNLDVALTKHFDSLFSNTHSVSIVEEGDRAAIHNLRAQSEQVKKNLSALTTVAGTQLHFRNNFLGVSITREKFEELIKDYIDETEQCVDQVLRETGTKTEDVDHVLAVGGSTRIPAVRQMLTDKFDKEPIASINPDEAVALGAAIQAAIIMQEQGLYDTPGMEDFELTDVTAFSYGFMRADRFTRRPYNSIIIPKNTPIPHKRTKRYYTIAYGQTQVCCTVTQGEGRDAENVKKMEEQRLALPPNRPAECEVDVTFSYDANNIMAANYLDVRSGGDKDIEIRMAGSGDSEEISGSGHEPNDLEDDDALDDVLL